LFDLQELALQSVPGATEIYESVVERISLPLPETALDTMRRLKECGLYNSVSLGGNSTSFLHDWVTKSVGPSFDNIMCAGNWNLLDQSGYSLFAECQRRGIAVHNAGIFGAGALWGRGTYRYKSIDPALDAKVRAWEASAAARDISLPALALQFAFMPEVVTHVALGMQTRREVQANLAMLAELKDHAGSTEWRTLWGEAQKEGLLRPDLVFGDDPRLRRSSKE